MAIVEGEQPTSAPPFREDDDAEIRESDIKVCVATFEVGDNPMIVGLKAADGEPAGRKIIEERDPCATSETTSEEVVDFSRHGS